MPLLSIHGLNSGCSGSGFPPQAPKQLNLLPCSDDLRTPLSHRFDAQSYLPSSKTDRCNVGQYVYVQPDEGANAFIFLIEEVGIL